MITSQTISTDTLISITPTQLKQINLIFNEHHSLLKQNDFLNKKVDTQDKLISDYKQIDSLRVIKLNNCESKVEQYVIQNDELKKQLKKTKRDFNLCKYVAGGGLIAAILLLCLR